MKLPLAYVLSGLILSQAATAAPQTTPLIPPAPVAPGALAQLNGRQLQYPISYSNPVAAILECDRAIYVLKTGYAQHWQKRDQYIEAFKKFPFTGWPSEGMRVERETMIEFLSESLPERHAMDEQLPLDVQVTRTIHALEKTRDDVLAIEAKYGG